MAKAVTKKEPVKKVTKEVVKEAPKYEVGEDGEVESKVSLADEDYQELQALRADKLVRDKAIEFKKHDYEYYGDFDKGSSVPAWSLERQIGMLEDEVRAGETNIRMGTVPADEVYLAKETLNMKKNRLKDIIRSKPKLTDTQKDALAIKTKELGEEIKRSKFTQYEMEKGLADPHEEATRMTEPCILVDKNEARRMGIATNNGYVSRNVAEGMWKNQMSLLGKGNNLNTEMLRETVGTGGRKRSQVSIGKDAYQKINWDE